MHLRTFGPAEAGSFVLDCCGLGRGVPIKVPTLPEPGSRASVEDEAVHVLRDWDLRIKRYQRQSSGMGKGAQVRVGPQVRRTQRTFREGVPRFGEFGRLGQVADSAI